ALTAWLSHRPTTDDVLRTRGDLTRGWLVAQQRPDGSWHDKWHASPYYATERCVTALSGHTGPTTRDAVRSAGDWVVATQRDEVRAARRGGGAGGVWGGTAEQAAYAADIPLAAAHRPAGSAVTEAMTRAEHVIRDASHPPGNHPPLWHDKPLSAPGAMARAE